MPDVRTCGTSGTWAIFELFLKKSDFLEFLWNSKIFQKLFQTLLCQKSTKIVSFRSYARLNKIEAKYVILEHFEIFQTFEKNRSFEIFEKFLKIEKFQNALK